MSTVKATTLSNLAGSLTITTDRVAQGTAAAWVNFNGTGTVAIRASFNVTSITDNGTGDYTVNFTSALPDANYSIAQNVGGTSAFVSRTYDELTARTASAFRQITYNAGGALTDVSQVNLTVFR